MDLSKTELAWLAAIAVLVCFLWIRTPSPATLLMDRSKAVTYQSNNQSYSAPFNTNHRRNTTSGYGYWDRMRERRFGESPR